MFSAGEYTATDFILRTCISLLHHWLKSKLLVQLGSLALHMELELWEQGEFCVSHWCQPAVLGGECRVSTASENHPLQPHPDSWFQMLELTKHKEPMTRHSLSLHSTLKTLLGAFSKALITLRTDPGCNNLALRLHTWKKKKWNPLEFQHKPLFADFH